MSVKIDFEEILNHAHFFNWAPDWNVVKDVYERFPESYSVLTPFAYTYLEELIRSTTSEYGQPPFRKNGKPYEYCIGMKLLNLAISENESNKEYVKLLEQAKRYFKYTSDPASENSRNMVMHGIFHPRFWYKDDFEELIHFIAKLSKFAQF